MGSHPFMDGRVINSKRDLDLIQALTYKVRKIALCSLHLLAVDGLDSSVKVPNK
jgi:hypothetical protein